MRVNKLLIFRIRMFKVNVIHESESPLLLVCIQFVASLFHTIDTGMNLFLPSTTKFNGWDDKGLHPKPAIKTWELKLNDICMNVMTISLDVLETPASIFPQKVWILFSGETNGYNSNPTSHHDMFGIRPVDAISQNKEDHVWVWYASRKGNKQNE